jgi:hypothetical protein
MTLRVTRRGFVKGTGLAAAAGVATGAGATSERGNRTLQRQPTLPLKQATPVFALVQSERRETDPGRLPEDLRRSLQAIAASVAEIQAEGPHKDWIAFHDGALTGRSGIAIPLGGAECSALAALSRQYGCWISVGARFSSDPQQGAALDAEAFFSPDGRLASLQPADGSRALGPGLSLVAVTEFGNLAATPRVDDPLLDAERIAAGAEFLLRTHSGALADWALDVPVCCRAHRIHGAVVSAAMSASTPPGAPDVTAGGSAFYGPDGRQLAAAEGSRAQWVTCAVPMARQRAASA